MDGSGHGATITPSPDSTTCEETDCHRDEYIALINPDGPAEPRTLCPQHRVKYLREVYDQ